MSVREVADHVFGPAPLRRRQGEPHRRRVLAATEEIRSAPADLVATTILSEPRRLAA
jgi:hypothetical protein